MSWKVLAAAVPLLLSGHSLAVVQNIEPKYSRLGSPCGDPAVHSDYYFTPEEFEGATVTKVVSGDAVVVTLVNGKRRSVSLGGVEAPDIKTEAGQSSRRYLSGLVLNKRVEVLFYGSDFRGKAVGLRVAAGGASPDVNLSVLESGMGRYRPAERLPSYDKCVYRLAAEKAEQGKKGLWKERFAQ